MRTRLQKAVDNATASAALEIEQLLQSSGAAWLEVSVSEGTPNKRPQAVVRVVTFGNQSAEVSFAIGSDTAVVSDAHVHENGAVARVLDCEKEVQTILEDMQLAVEELRLPWKK